MSEIVNKPGSNTFQEILNAAVHMPGLRVNRAEFLRTALSKYFLKDVVNMAIEFNPAQAGISINDLSKITKSCISYETNKVRLWIIYRLLISGGMKNGLEKRSSKGCKIWG